MSFPKTTFPRDAIAEYLSGASLLNMAVDHRSSARSLRRWLIEQGVEIRRQGCKVKKTKKRSRK